MTIIESKGKYYIQRGRSIVQTFNGFADLMSGKPIVLWSSIRGCHFDTKDSAIDALALIKKVQKHRNAKSPIQK